MGASRVGLRVATDRTGGRPADWPGPGTVDADRHDLPHASSTLEWWYVNSHLTTDTGRELSLFASFFRTAIGRDESKDAYVYAHALTWAIVDPVAGLYLPESLVDREAPAIVRRRLERGDGTSDALMRRAMLEVVGKGRVPLPDVLLGAPCGLAADRLSLDYDGRRWERRAPRGYRLELHRADGRAACRLDLTLRKPLVRHGDDGLVRGKAGEDMFYYFCPRCDVEGELELDGARLPVRGGGWYDHEFGRLRTGDDGAGAAASPSLAVSWNWLSAQLDDGSDISLYNLYDTDAGRPLGRFAVLVDPAGDATTHRTFTFRGYRPWTSSRTFLSYPTTWRVRVPEADLALDVEAAFGGQEFRTMIARPSFWEGRVTVRGSLGGRAVTGVGFVERSGFESADRIDDFLSAVGRQTRRSVRSILPTDLNLAAARRLGAAEGQHHYLHGIDLEQMARTLVDPIRAVVDRGGKAWRSWVALACCDVVGGDSQPYLQWLALPELVHVGSLMVDDVQDRSAVRRGGPAAHHLFGEAKVINAGSMCYFLPQIFIERANLSDERRLRIYRLYFEALRAAHVGQALDIDGCAHRLRDAVEDGGGTRVERHVRAVHRLKSAVPASCLGRIGAVMGGGSEAQIAGVGRYLEAVGVAFQIVDDMLNLQGFERDLKSVGEDIVEGKVTMPVAKAVSRLDLSGRRRLWELLNAPVRDADAVAEAIGMIRDCGALAACRQEADRLIERGWGKLARLLDDSQAKLMLRSFGWFVLDRHY